MKRGVKIQIDCKQEDFDLLLPTVKNIIKILWLRKMFSRNLFLIARNTVMFFRQVRSMMDSAQYTIMASMVLN